MVIITIAGKEVNFGGFANLPSTPVPGAPSLEVSEQVAQDPGFQKTVQIFSNIIGQIGRAGGLPESQFEQVTSTNLINLGQASLDISAALNTVATQQNEQIASLSGTVAQINQRVSQQLIDLGQAVTDASKAVTGTDPLSQFGSLLTGSTFGVPTVLLLGGLVIGVLVLK